MKKSYEMIVKAIEVTKKYNWEEIVQLSWLFNYLNSLEIDEQWFWTWVSAKWLWKLLNPLTRSWNSQPFREWWESVSNLSRLKENKDYEIREEIIFKDVSNKANFVWRENSQRSKLLTNQENLRIWENSQILKKTKFRWVIPIKDKDYILTLRAWEYCAVLTKWNSWDLYRRFIFDIKDEFLRLVFREWKVLKLGMNSLVQSENFYLWKS